MPVLSHTWQDRLFAIPVTAEVQYWANKSRDIVSNSRQNMLPRNGFVAPTPLNDHSDSAEISERLDAIKAELKPLEHGDEFISQIDIAARVFSPPAAPVV